MRRNKDAWILIVLFLILLAGGYFAATGDRGAESELSTSFNPDKKGVKAFHTLLDRLGFRPRQLRTPYDEIPADARVLIVVQPTERIEDPEALRDWVRRGGVVIFASDKLEGVPAAFGWNHQLGKGHIYADRKSVV